MTVDLHFQLEYHTAPPSVSTMEVLFPDSKEPLKIPVPEFHGKEIRTVETMLAGTAKLIGSWRPTGKPEFEKNDLMQVVFLKVDIHEFGSIAP